VLVKRGFEITGSDLQVGHMAYELAEAGAMVYMGHDDCQIEGADAIVVSTAIPETNPEPKPDLMTRAMDFDRKMLSKEEGLRKNAQAVVNTGKAIKRPFERTKNALTDFVDNLIRQDEDKTKMRMLEDKNYRTTVCKVFRALCNLGLYSVAFMVSPYIGALSLAGGAVKYADKTRQKKEVQKDFVTEIQIIDDKIRRARDKGDYEASYELMRIRRKMVDKASQITKDPIAKVKATSNPMNKHGYDYW